jgi:hypothetical protein
LTATKQSVAEAANLGAMRDAYVGNWLQALDGEPLRYLRPGCYVALLDDAPFIEDGLRRYQSRKGRSVVIGIMKEPVHAD